MSGTSTVMVDKNQASKLEPVIRMQPQITRCQTLRPRFKAGEKQQAFHFSSVFGETTEQHTYFKATAEELVHALVNMRQSGVMMAHGMSGAGKTYTMEVCQKLQGVGLMQE